MINNRQSLGKLGENIAVNFLKKKGYQILDRNFKTSRFGEIDIVALTKTDTDVIQTSTDKTQILVGKFKILDFIRNSFKFVIRRKSPQATIVFVEVKTKASDEFGSPEDEFTIFKKQKMRRTIQDWFWARKIETNNWRIDLIAIDFSKDEKNPEIRYYPGCLLSSE